MAFVWICAKQPHVPKSNSATWADALILTQITTTCTTNMKPRPSKDMPAENMPTAIRLPAKATVSATALSAINARPNAHPMTNAPISTATVITTSAEQMAVVLPINLYRYGE